MNGGCLIYTVMSISVDATTQFVKKKKKRENHGSGMVVSPTHVDALYPMLFAMAAIGSLFSIYCHSPSVAKILSMLSRKYKLRAYNTQVRISTPHHFPQSTASWAEETLPSLCRLWALEMQTYCYYTAFFYYHHHHFYKLSSYQR